MKSGFTLIELLITIGILALIFGYGTVIGVNYYRSQLLFSERDKLVSLISLVRSQALNNVNESDHGIYIGGSQYTVYQGSSYTSRNAALDENFPEETSLVFSGPADIAFHSPDASVSSTGIIVISNSFKNLSVSVNSEGLIDW